MNYRGDTFIRNYSVETDTGDYTFEREYIETNIPIEEGN